MVSIFAEWMCDALTTPLPVGDDTPHENWRNDTKRSLCNNCLVFFCVETFAVKKVSGLQLWTGLSNTSQHCWSRLWQLWSVSYEFVHYGPQFRAHTDWALVRIDRCTHKITYHLHPVKIIISRYKVKFVFLHYTAQFLHNCKSSGLYRTVQTSFLKCVVGMRT